MTTLVDSHIHIGRSHKGEPVKIGAGSNLTLRRIPGALRDYGAGLGCVVDLATRRGLGDLEEMLLSGALTEDEDGSFRAQDGTRLVGGLEAEFRVGEPGPFHLLAYVGGLSSLRALQRLYGDSVRNADLSTQRLHLPPEEFRREVQAIGGALAVAHAFTPHRGLIGVGWTPEELFSDTASMGLELGLSADVEIARGVGAIGELGLIGGSDAHGEATIGRELNEISAPETGFRLVRRLVQDGADRIYGMNPAFGKYHRSFCPACSEVIVGEPPKISCPSNPRHRVVVGVLDRASMMDPPQARRRYPDYTYQLPLGLLPGFGASARRRLIEEFGSLHQAMHLAPLERLSEIVGQQRAQELAAMRIGAGPMAPGGGGRWGKA